MYVIVTVGNIQGKSRFTVAESESRNSTVAEDRIQGKTRFTEAGESRNSTSIYLFLSIYLSIHPSIYLSIYLSVYLIT